MASKATIRTDLHDAVTLPRLARVDCSARAVRRMLAIAHAMEGMSFTETARVVGIERQSLGDAIQLYNAECLSGHYDRPKPGRPHKLGPVPGGRALQRHRRRPRPRETNGISAYTLDDLAAIVAARFQAFLSSTRARQTTRCWQSASIGAEL
mgnify:CR=1 FL=1